MRSLYKISLAILAVGFLVVAGSAYAQDMAKPTTAFNGNIGTGFGIYTFDKTTDVANSAATTKAFSEYEISYETNMRWTWNTDNWYSLVHLRARQVSGGSGAAASANGGNPVGGGANDLLAGGSDAYVENWWLAGAFKLGIGKFEGASPWQNPLSGSYYTRNSIGDNEYLMSWTSVPGIDAEYNLGAAQIGVAISTLCVPSCNNTAAPGGRAVTGTSTLAPHAAGTAGPVKWMVQLPSTAGTQNSAASTTSTSESGTGYAAGASYAGAGGLNLALDLIGFTDKKDTNQVAQLKDRTQSLFNLSATIPAGPGQAYVAYFNGTNNNYGENVGGKTFTSSVLTLRYIIPMSFATLVPEYRQATNGGAIAEAAGVTPKDAVNSEFRLIMKALF